MKELFFYFDFSSPFAYLGATQVEACAARAGAVVRYRPFLLGGLFREIGTPNVPISAASDAKRRHYLADMSRWADHYGVRFRFPSRFPMNSVKALRIAIALPEEARRAVVLPIFEAFWADDRDISDEKVLHNILVKTGFNPADASAALEKTNDEAIKTALKAATDKAKVIGICGAPSFLVGDLLFWGQDRLLFVEKALNGWRPALEPASRANAGAHSLNKV